MIVLLSPAKNLNFDCAYKGKISEPLFLDEVSKILTPLQKMEIKDLEKLMKISPKLATDNYKRFQNFVFPADNNTHYPAIFLYAGQVYQTLQAASLSKNALDFAQDHLRILSGLYGFLKPLDNIQPYRLEMKTRLSIGEYKNLYAFWKEKLTQKLNNELSQQKNQLVINLSSDEYFKAIDPKKINGKIITITFKTFKNGVYKSIMSYLKIARGLMTRHILENKITKLEDIKLFAQNNYSYNPDLSIEANNYWVFTNKNPFSSDVYGKL